MTTRVPERPWRTALLAAGAGLVAASAVPAYGYWTDRDTSGVDLDVATLAPPQASARRDASDLVVDVAAPVTGPTPSAYTVTRDGRVVCTLLAPGACRDTTPPTDAPADYDVAAHLGDHWTAVAVVTAPVAVPTTTRLPTIAAETVVAEPTERPDQATPGLVPDVPAERRILTGSLDGLVPVGDSVGAGTRLTVSVEEPLALPPCGASHTGAPTDPPIDAAVPGTATVVTTQTGTLRLELALAGCGTADQLLVEVIGGGTPWTDAGGPTTAHRPDSVIALDPSGRTATVVLGPSQGASDDPRPDPSSVG